VVTSKGTADPRIEPGTRVLVAGIVTHRQRPATAQGVTFLNLEDETGLLNVVISVGCWKAHRRLAQSGKALVVRGILERTPEGVVNIVADKLETLDLSVTGRGSRDFR
jgi:error-prone DNA polymerase